MPLELKNITRADVAGAPLVNVPKLGSVCVKTGVSTPSDTLCLAPSSKIEAKTIFLPGITPVTPVTVPEPKKEHEVMSTVIALSPPPVFWQVQVIASVDKAATLATQKALSKSGIESVLIFEVPFYKLRVGPYITKQATWAAQKELRKRFAGAFAVKC